MLSDLVQFIIYCCIFVMQCLIQACLLYLPIQDFDALLQSLDVCGVRELQLHSMLQQIEAAFKENVRMLQKNSDNDVENHVRDKDTRRPNLYVSKFDRPEPSDSFAIQLGRNIAENNDVLRRYSDFEKWMWDECLNSTLLSAMQWGERRRKKLLNICDHCHALHLFTERHWHHCHTASACASIKKPSPPVQISLLKAQLASMEVRISCICTSDMATSSFHPTFSCTLCL